MDGRRPEPTTDADNFGHASALSGTRLLVSVVLANLDLQRFAPLRAPMTRIGIK